MISCYLCCPHLGSGTPGYVAAIAKTMPRMWVVSRTRRTPSRFIDEFVVLDFGRALDTYITEFSRLVEGLGIGEQTQKVGGLENRLRNARAAMEA